MFIELSIEEAMDAFGRENVARYIQNGLRIDHSAAIRIALSKEGIRPSLVPRELTDLRIKIQGAGNTMMPPRPKRKKILLTEAQRVSLDTLNNYLEKFKKEK